MPVCHVIIPTVKSGDTLKKTLTALRAQTVSSSWEIKEWVESDEHRTGPAATRNRALNSLPLSSGEVVFFLGDDIILQPGALGAHLDFHEQNPDPSQAALGFIKWDPRLPPSSLMQWLEHGGPQNNFDEILGIPPDKGARGFVDPARFFYASHLSLKAGLLANHRFDERFGRYGYEDAELGYRLKQRGLKLAVLPAAVGLHHHLYTTAAVASRQISVGQNALLFSKLTQSPNLFANRPAQHSRRKLLITLRVPDILRFIVGQLDALNLSAPTIYAYFTGLWYWKGVYHNSTQKRDNNT